MFGSVYGHGPRFPGGDWRLEPFQHPHGHTALGRRLPCSRDLSVLLPSEKLEALNGRVRFQDHSQVAGLHLKSGSSPRVFRVEITGACAARGFWLCCHAAVGCVFLLPAFNCSVRESAPHLAPQCLHNRVSARRETRFGGSLFLLAAGPESIGRVVRSQRGVWESASSSSWDSHLGADFLHVMGSWAW